MIKIIVIFACLSVEIDGFSYNTYSKIVFTPANSNNHSYFGYTTLIKNGDTPFVIVTAPKDDSYHINHKLLQEPGALYICKIHLNETKTTCFQKIIDTDGNTMQFRQNGKSFIHGKDNMWLGMSMVGSDYDNETTIICAPRWHNKWDNTIYLLNGMCYAVKNLMDTNTNTNILLPMVDRATQGFRVNDKDIIEKYGPNVYFHAYGQSGFSSALSDDGKELVLGAPGTFIWAGSAVKYKITKLYSNDYYSKQLIPNPYFTPEIALDSYFGYSIGIGKFSKVSSNLYVAGAPRGSDYKGQVIIFDFPIRERGRINILATLNGTQMGEYFGSTIATIDINQDGLTDLIIGAPTFSEKFLPDLGRIYVYINNDKGNFILQDNIICGSVRTGARFGSTITSIGDINQDGFLDVAVGAPYENDGRGAVYIYLGTANGLNNIYVQRIAISNMFGFGISISKAIDIDNNSCKDIVIGAHESASAVLLRCHPSTHVQTRIESIPAELSTNDTDFTVQVCAQFQGTKYVTDLELSLTIDPEYRRVKLNDPAENVFYLSGSDKDEVCRDIMVDLKVKDMDYSRPIEIQLTYKLKRNPLTEYEFCSNCTVLRPGGNQRSIMTVPFAAGCGSDLICSPNLKLNVETLAKSSFTIGTALNISLIITLENTGEPAFLANTEFILPNNTPLLRIPSQCNTQESKLICDFGNPLPPEEKKSILVELDASHLKNSDKMLEINITATSAGQEINPDDNIALLNLPLNTVADIDIIGNSGSLEYIYIDSKATKLKNITAVHTYEVINKGPSSLDTITVRFFLPVLLYNHTIERHFEIMKVLAPTATINQQQLQCKTLSLQFYEVEKQGEDEDLFNSTETTQQNSVTESQTLDVINENQTQEIAPTESGELKKEYMNYLPVNIDDRGYPHSIHINCSDQESVTCLIVECSGTGLSPGHHRAQISFQMLLNTYSIAQIMDHKNSIIVSTYSTVQNEFVNNSNVKSAWARSLLVGETALPEPIPMWIYFLSLLLGVLLLALISAILYKIGFFRRKTKEEMELLKNQEESHSEVSEVPKT